VGGCRGGGGGGGGRLLDLMRFIDPNEGPKHAFSTLVLIAGVWCTTIQIRSMKIGQSQLSTFDPNYLASGEHEYYVGMALYLLYCWRETIVDCTKMCTVGERIHMFSKCHLLRCSTSTMFTPLVPDLVGQPHIQCSLGCMQWLKVCNCVFMWDLPLFCYLRWWWN